MKITGANKVKGMMRRLPAEIGHHSAMANKDNAEAVASLARVFIPSVTGANRAKIRTFPGEGNGYVVDFGDKAKVIEGRNAPRPFVNPALRATKAERSARARKATRDAIKAARNGG